MKFSISYFSFRTYIFFHVPADTHLDGELDKRMDDRMAGELDSESVSESFSVCCCWERTEAIGRAEVNDRRWRFGHVIGRKRNLRIETSDADDKDISMSAAASFVLRILKSPRAKWHQIVG